MNTRIVASLALLAALGPGLPLTVGRAADRSAATPDATVFVNHDPIAGADTLGTDQNKPASVSVRKLLLNDRDADGDNLMAYLVDKPQFGALALNVVAVVCTATDVSRPLPSR